MCPLVDFSEVLCSSAKELQQNSNTSSREDYIPQILTVLSEILHISTWSLWPFAFCLSRLSFANNSYNNVTTPSTNQRFWPDSGQILRHQYGISVAESQTFLRAKRPQRRRARRTDVFAGYYFIFLFLLSDPFQTRFLVRWVTHLCQGIYNRFVHCSRVTGFFGAQPLP